MTSSGLDDSAPQLFAIIIMLIKQMLMSKELNIFITNDDGYTAKGIHALVRMMRTFGRVTVIAPKHHQSGMSTAVSMGGKAMAYRKVSDSPAESWAYLDATPASCVKFAVDEVFKDGKPDVVVCGINHGSNAASAVNYSGTLGAAEEAAINGIPGIGVSLDTMHPDADFSAVEAIFPSIFMKLMENLPDRKGTFYNINFPNIPLPEIKGVRVGHQGYGHWEKEFLPWDVDFFLKRGFSPESLGQTSNPPKEEGEELYLMAGEFVDDSPAEDRLADHHILEDGYVSIVAHNIDFSDGPEIERLRTIGLDQDF